MRLFTTAAAGSTYSYLLGFVYNGVLMGGGLGRVALVMTCRMPAAGAAAAWQ